MDTGIIIALIFGVASVVTFCFGFIPNIRRSNILGGLVVYCLTERFDKKRVP